MPNTSNGMPNPYPDDPKKSEFAIDYYVKNGGWSKLGDFDTWFAANKDAVEKSWESPDPGGDSLPNKAQKALDQSNDDKHEKFMHDEFLKYQAAGGGDSYDNWMHNNQKAIEAKYEISGGDEKPGDAAKPDPFKLDTKESEEIRGKQLELVKALQDQAAGKGPSLVEGQLQRATDQNMQNAMSFGAAQQGQGLGGPSALLAIGRNQAAIQQEAAGQSALAKGMEQMQAQQQLAQLLGGTRGQDLGAASTQLGVSSGVEMNKINNDNRVDATNAANQRADANYWRDTLVGLGGAAAKGVGGALLTAATAENGTGPQASSDQTAAPGQADQPSAMGDYSKGYNLPQGSNSGLDSLTGWNNPYATAHAHSGGMIKGWAGIAGDSPKNDTVPAMLSPGEIVIPRSVAQAPDAASRAAAFVDAIKKAKRSAR